MTTAARSADRPTGRLAHLQASTQEEYVRHTADEYAAASPGSDHAAVEVVLAVHAANLAYRNAGRELTQALGSEITVERYSVLRAIAYSEERRLTQKEIATRVLASWHSVTDLVAGLEQDGLVARARSERDRRSQVVSLTQAGEALVATYTPRLAELARRACEPFTAEEKRAVTDALLRLCHAVEGAGRAPAAAGAARPGCRPAPGTAGSIHRTSSGGCSGSEAITP